MEPPLKRNNVGPALRHAAVLSMQRVGFRTLAVLSGREDGEIGGYLGIDPFTTASLQSANVRLCARLYGGAPGAVSPTWTRDVHFVL